MKNQFKIASSVLSKPLISQQPEFSTQCKATLVPGWTGSLRIAEHTLSGVYG
jgi:hypothetical protein